MAGRSKISQHPAKEKILEDIAAGVTNVEISRRYGVSESAVSRAKTAHFDVLSREFDDEQASPTDLLGRLADLADSARRARIYADRSGSPQVKARAQANELAALEKLLDRSGVTDTTVIRTAQEAGALTHVLREFLETRPDAAPDLAQVLGQHESTLGLRDAVLAFSRKTSTND